MSVQHSPIPWPVRASHRQRIIPLRPETIHQRPQGRLAAGAHHHPGTMAGQYPGEVVAETTGGAGDQGGGVAEIGGETHDGDRLLLVATIAQV